MTDPAESLSEATRLGILQGRFEALHLGAKEVTPEHLLLGLLKTMDPAHLDAEGLDPRACEGLIRALNSTPAPAPLSPNDIEYTQACYQQIAMALESAEGRLVEPAHLLAVLRAQRDDG